MGMVDLNHSQAWSWLTIVNHGEGQPRSTEATSISTLAKIHG
jgi:hypothetical protein